MFLVTIWNDINPKPKWFFMRKNAIKYITDYYFPNEQNPEYLIQFKDEYIYDTEGYKLGLISPNPDTLTGKLDFAITVFNLSIGIISLIILLIHYFG